MSESDFTVRDEGSIILVTPNTPAAMDWIEEHLPDDVPWFGRAMGIEANYAQSILNGIREEGLTLD